MRGTAFPFLHAELHCVRSINQEFIEYTHRESGEKSLGPAGQGQSGQKVRARRQPPERGLPEGLKLEKRTAREGQGRLYLNC